MRKDEFIALLRKKLNGLPKNDVEERLDFYGEMIDDRIEEGLSEKDAVDAVGDIDAIANQIIDDVPLKKLIKEKLATKNRLDGWTIAFLILGFPIWFSLLVSAFAVLFSLYATLWAVVVSLWSIVATFGACTVACGFGGIAFICCGLFNTGLATVGVALVFAGLGILSFFACKEMTKGCAIFTKNSILCVKKLCMRKENAQ